MDRQTAPHQDPITKPPRRPTDGLAAAQLDIEELKGRVAAMAYSAGQGDELLQNQVNALQLTVGQLVEHVEALNSQMRTIYGVLKASKIIPE